MQTFDPSAMRGDLSSIRFEPGPTEGKMVLNMGPQHPSTHGVLRIMLELDGEYILRAEPVLGYVHRMHDWMAEQKTYMQFLPNMGRVDYLHAMAWNWSYVGALERLAGIEVPERAEYIRVAVTELNRIGSHLLWWGAYLLDLGAFTPVMYAFDDREHEPRHSPGCDRLALDLFLFHDRRSLSTMCRPISASAALSS